MEGRSQELLWRDWMRLLVHDLRNLLTASLTNIAYVQRAGAGHPESKQALDETRGALERMNGVMQDALDLEKLLRGTFKPTFRMVDVGAVCQWAGDGACKDGKQLAIEVNGECVVAADLALMRRICAHLFEEGLRRARGVARVVVTGEADQVVVRVESDGPAAAAHELGYGADPRVALQGTITAAGSLGIAVASLYAALQGGELRGETGAAGGLVRVLRLTRRGESP